MAAAGRLLASNAMPSATADALHEPQSPMPVTMTSELADIAWHNCFRLLGIDPRSYSHEVSSTVSLERTDPAAPEPWTSPSAAAQRPPRLLLTLLGDYWWQRTEPLPSAAIVALLAEFGVSDSAARAALSRLTRNGLLVTSKTGRRTLSPR